MRGRDSAISRRLALATRNAACSPGDMLRLPTRLKGSSSRSNVVPIAFHCTAARTRNMLALPAGRALTASNFLNHFQTRIPIPHPPSPPSPYPSVLLASTRPSSPLSSTDAASGRPDHPANRDCGIFLVSWRPSFPVAAIVANPRHQ